MELDSKKLVRLGRVADPRDEKKKWNHFVPLTGAIGSSHLLSATAARSVSRAGRPYAVVVTRTVKFDTSFDLPTGQAIRLRSRWPGGP